MSTFDPMAAALDWLDAYRAASLSIVDLYAELASLECACGGRRIMVGHDAITAYWGQRFREKPAQHTGPDIVVSYRVPDAVVQALLRFDDVGKIERSRCGPLSGDPA
jgi:hypothetical protein